MLKAVEIKSDDPNVLYYPTCTTIEQCGGCCGHDMLECAPSEEQAIPIQVSFIKSAHQFTILICILNLFKIKCVHSYL